MKLNYRIETKSKLDAKILKERIILWLSQADYNLISHNGNYISFNLQGWGPNGKQFDKVNGGTFEILEFGEERILKFSYYFTFTFELFFIFLFIIMSFFKKGPFWFLLIALFITLLIRYFVAKAKCQEVLNILAAEE